MMNLDDLLSELVERKGSDLFVTVGSPPTLKVNGHLVSLGGEALDKKGGADAGQGYPQQRSLRALYSHQGGQLRDLS